MKTDQLIQKLLEIREVRHDSYDVRMKVENLLYILRTENDTQQSN